MLQRVAVYRSVLQCVAGCCSAMNLLVCTNAKRTPQGCCSGLHWVAVGCSVLQRVAVCRSVSYCEVIHCLMCTNVKCTPRDSCSVLQCVAVCCSALQNVAVRCSVLQCVAARCSASRFENGRPGTDATLACGLQECRCPAATAVPDYTGPPAAPHPPRV